MWQNSGVPRGRSLCHFAKFDQVARQWHCQLRKGLPVTLAKSMLLISAEIQSVELFLTLQKSKA